MTGPHIGTLNVALEVKGTPQTILWSLTGRTPREQWYNGQLPLTAAPGASYRVGDQLLCYSSVHTSKTFLTFILVLSI